MNLKMNAVEYSNGKIYFSEVDIKMPEENEILVKVYFSGLCGSDLQRFKKILPASSLILGHEFIGEIAEYSIKNNVRTIKCTGNFIVCSPLIVCKTCPPCMQGKTNLCKNGGSVGLTRNGGFSEYVTIPKTNAIPIPELMKEYALADCVAVCLNAINKINCTSFINKEILIIGNGALGCINAIILKMLGAKISLTGRKRKVEHLLESIVEKYISDLEKVSLNKYDYVFEAVGSNQGETLDIAIKAVAPGGYVIVLGVFPAEFKMQITPRELFIKEVHLIGVKSYTANDFIESLNVIKKYQTYFSKLISVAPLRDFEVRISDKEKPVKLMFDCKQN